MRLGGWLVCLCAMWASAAPAAQVLLVGVGEYPHLPAQYQLHGPSNDVRLLREVLQTQFGVPAQRITTLTDGPADSPQLPTRANIEREFRRLAQTAQAGEQVLILLAGHGTQQPERVAGSEPDGLDELFLPRDVTAWSAPHRSVPNALVDDDLATWLQAIRQTGAAVTLLVDSCHAGTLARGGEVARTLPPTALGIPPASAGQRGFSASRTFDVPAVGGFVAVYACQAHEVTTECVLPPGTATGHRHGLLTFAVCAALTQSQGPLTYHELVRRVQLQFASWGRSAPTPLLEGGDGDREFLSTRTWPQRAHLHTVKTPTGLTLNAGTLHALTPGSIVRISPPPGQGTTPLGHARVTTVRLTDADLEPCAYGTLPVQRDLPAGGVATLVYTDYGPLQLRVAIPPKSAAGLRSLAGLLSEQPLFRLGSVAEADWLITHMADQVWLVAADGTQTLGPVRLGADTADWLIRQLNRLARAHNLLTLASRPAKATGVDVELLIAGRGRPERIAYHAEAVHLHIRNRSPLAQDVTVLYLDGDRELACLFPNVERQEVNRLQPGEQQVCRCTASAEKVVAEQFVVIAVPANGPVVHFAHLALPTPRGPRERAGQANGLEQLFTQAVFGGGQRGLARTEETPAPTLQLVPVQLRPGPRP